MAVIVEDKPVLRECVVALPVDLLQRASDRGILVRTRGGRYFGLGPLVEHTLNERLKVPA